MAIPLEHRYTHDGLTCLKGVDAAKARVLEAAAQAADCAIYLAQVTLWESGSAEPDYDSFSRRSYGRRRSDNTPRQHVMSEIFETSLSAEHWRNLRGERPGFSALPLEREEIVPEESLTAIKPKEEYEGYTGNAGMTLQRWYRHAALVLWPQARHFEVLCEAGSYRATSALRQMVKSWRKMAEPEAGHEKERCLTFATQILKRWQYDRGGHWSPEVQAENLDNPIACLVLLGDVALIRQYLGEVLIKDPQVSPSRWTIKAIADHGWATFRPELVVLMLSSDARTIKRNVQFFDQLCLFRARRTLQRKELVEARETCRQMAAAAVAACLKLAASKDPFDWRTGPVAFAWLLPRLMRGLVASGFEDLLSQVVADMLAQPKIYPLLKVQLPALFTLRRWLKHNLTYESLPLKQWIAACREQLESSTASEPEPPRDFRRAASHHCDCADCRELNRFLLDPSAGEHRFQMAQQRREHLENKIKYQRLDLDQTTDRRLRPHTLVCIKNMASYGRKLAEHHNNQRRLEQLRAMERDLSG